MSWIVLTSVYRQDSLTKLLNNQVLRFFGVISYSLYLWQQVFSAAPAHYLVDSWLCVPPLMFVAATLSYYGIERPCIQVGKRLVSAFVHRSRAELGIVLQK
jgi:peptidoglycan/LPS O-acetylase OafA/YrhL